MLRDLEKIHSSLEPALPRHLAGDVRQLDWRDRSNHDMAVTHAIAACDLDVAALPDPDGASDLAASDAITELLGKDHDRLSLTLPEPLGWSPKRVSFKLSLPAGFAYYVVCPPRALKLPQVKAFRDWLLAEALPYHRLALRP